MLVSRMPWRRSSARSASVISGEGGAASLISLPFEVPAVPGPDEPLGQHQDEHEHRDQGTRGQRGEGHREGQEEEQLDVKDQEQDRVQVVVGPELDPRVARRRQAALVHGVLGLARLGRLEQPEPELRQAQGRQGKRHRNDCEDGEERIGVRAHGIGTSITASPRFGSMLIGGNCALIVIASRRSAMGRSVLGVRAGPGRRRSPGGPRWAPWAAGSMPGVQAVQTPATGVPQKRHLPASSWNEVTEYTSRSITGRRQFGQYVVPASATSRTLPRYTYRSP